MKSLILVLSSSTNANYRRLADAVRETWYNYKNGDTEIIFYYDNTHTKDKKRCSFEDSNLIVPAADGYADIGKKTTKAFEWALQNREFDYIYRSNLGAYINVEKMNKFLDGKPATGFYSGIVGYLMGEAFVSGSGYFLSRDLVELAVKDQNDFDYSVIDDVSLGKFMAHKGVKPDLSAQRWSISNGIEEYHIGDITITKDDINFDLLYHTRLRSNNRTLDIQKMKYLYSIKF